MRIKIRHVATFMVFASFSTAALSQNALDRIRDRLQQLAHQTQKSDSSAQQATARSGTPTTAAQHHSSTQSGARAENRANKEIFGIALGMTQREVLAAIMKRDKYALNAPLSGLSFALSLNEGRGLWASGDANSYCVHHFGLGKDSLEPFTCQRVEYRHPLPGGELQSVTAILVADKVVVVSFQHSRGKDRFAFDPSKMVRDKYGPPGNMQTSIGNATLSFSENLDPKTKEVTKYHLEFGLHPDGVRQLLKNLRAARAAKRAPRRAISAPPL